MFVSIVYSVKCVLLALVRSCYLPAVFCNSFRMRDWCTVQMHSSYTCKWHVFSEPVAFFQLNCDKCWSCLDWFYL